MATVVAMSAANMPTANKLKTFAVVSGILLINGITNGLITLTIINAPRPNPIAAGKQILPLRFNGAFE